MSSGLSFVQNRGDQLVEQLFPNRKALEHTVHLVSTLSDPNTQYEILHMEDWNSDAYEKQVGAPHCAKRFDSMNSHTVSNDLDSMNS